MPAKTPTSGQPSKASRFAPEPQAVDRALLLVLAGLAIGVIAILISLVLRATCAMGGL